MLCIWQKIHSMRLGYCLYINDLRNLYDRILVIPTLPIASLRLLEVVIMSSMKLNKNFPVSLCYVGRNHQDLMLL